MCIMYQTQYNSHTPRPLHIQTMDIDGYYPPPPYLQSNYKTSQYITSPSHKYIMKLNPNDWTSLYIPCLDSSYTREYLAYLMETKYSIGKVQHIDLISLSKKDNYTNKVDDVSAFIHFHVWYNNEFTQFLRNRLERYHKYNLGHYSRYFTTLHTNTHYNENYDLGNYVNHEQYPISKYLDDCDNFVLMINKSQSVRRNASISTLSSLDELEQVSEISLRRETSLASNLETLGNMNSQQQYVLDRLEKYDRRIELLEEEVRTLRKLMLDKMTD